MIRSRICGVGGYLPEKILTNKDIEKILDTSHEWIVERTGICQRHIAAKNELTSDLATNAAEQALKAASLTSDQIDFVIVATTTPDETFPSTATKVQHRLGMKRGFAFDVQAVCSGFLFALSIGDNFLRLNQAKTGLIIGAETFSRLLDWEDRSTAILFGDGAGAFIITQDTTTNRGILSTDLYSQGDYHDNLYMDGGVSLTQTVGKIKMQGREVYKNAVPCMEKAARKILEKHALQIDDVRYIIPHQANLRILEAVAQRLGINMEKMIITINKQANTSAASIPLAFKEAIEKGYLKEGDLLLLLSMAAGFAWGASLIVF